MKNNIKKINKLTINKELAMFLIGAIITVLVLIGSSYAIFTMVITSNKEHSVTSGILSIKFEENSEVINLNNAYPMSDNEGLNTKSYNIKITNTGTIDAKYRISLKDDSSIKNIVPKSLLKLSYKEGTNNYINPILISSLENEAIIVKDKILAVKTSINYEFKIWLDISAGNEVQSKTYKSKIVVESVPLTDDYSDTISPVLKLNGELNNNLLKGEVFTDLGIESVTDNKDTLNKDNVVKSYEYFNGTTTTIVDNINTNNLGIYFIYYKISDMAGNTGIVVRTVNINNTTPPTINLIGNATIELLEGSSYSEPGVTAINNKGENISSKVLTLGSVNHLKTGTYILKYISIDSDNNMSSTTRTVNVIRTIYIFDYTGASQMFTVPRNGTYKVELWGASGSNQVGFGAYGGYTNGNIILNQNENMYLYVGQTKRSCNSYTACTGLAFNGGGAGGFFTYNSYPTRSPGGGGATDIRLIGGNWDNNLGLRSRIMVASGAGSSWKATIHADGGGLIGYQANNFNNGYPGTQTNGGEATSSATAGGFGYGGNGYISDPECPNSNDGYGGGGGYYGGGGGRGDLCVSSDIDRAGSGGGGSSFISGHTGAVAITSANDQTPKTGCASGTTNNDCSIHYSNKIFTNTLMIDGAGYKWTNVKSTVQQMPNTSGGLYALGVGHSGNGYAKITLISLN